MRRTTSSIVAGVLLPPLGVHLAGAPIRDLWIATALTVLGFLPGVAFALVTILRIPPAAA